MYEKQSGRIFNPGFDQLKYTVNETGIPLYICLYPDKEVLNEKNINKENKSLNGVKKIALHPFLN